MRDKNGCGAVVRSVLLSQEDVLSPANVMATKREEEGMVGSTWGSEEKNEFR